MTTETGESKTDVEKFAFSADINQLLGLIINTFYSNKDIFLRELVSNASDALDKIRYKSITQPDALGEAKDLDILIRADPEARQLIIRDFGIGMTKQELINNLGTIAKSGTKAFMEAMQAGADVSMIGQFGVGFYSAFLVANKVTVHSKSNDDEGQWVWESDAGGSFSVVPDTGESLERGTKLVLHMKPDMLDYLQEDKIRKLVQKHADFIDFTIKLWTQKSEENEVTDDEAEEGSDGEGKGEEGSSKAEKGKEVEDSTTADESGDTDTSTTDKPSEDPEVTVEDVDEDEEKKDTEPKKKTKKVQRVWHEWEPLNYQKPLWTRKPDDITEEEYASFYKAIANDYEPHQAVKHFSVEGQVEFKALLYVPKRPAFDLYDKGMKKMDNIKLYVRRVFIMDRIEDLMPSYLCFVKGVVDSEDLPLNISREMLQQNKITRVMRKHLIKRSLQMIEDIAENDDRYKVFYESFGKNIKLGVHEDFGNKDRLSKLLRYPSAATGEDMISFQDYVDAMPEKQKYIYYITGESISQMKNTPFVEKLRRKGYNVLYMTDPMDEYCMNQLKNFGEKEFVCVTKEGLVLDAEQDEIDHVTKRCQELEPMCKGIKELLGEDVEKVVVSARLLTTPCVLVTALYGWTANMERLVKAQALQNNSTQIQSQFMAPRKTLEIHHDHPVIKRLEQLFAEDKEGDRFRESVRLLYNTTLISSGFTIPSPSDYAAQINRLIALGLEVEDLDEWEQEVRGKDAPVEEAGKEEGDDKKTEASDPTDTQMEEVD